MTRPRADPQLFAAGHLINNLATVWTTALQAIDDLIAELDGYPTKTPGASLPTYTPTAPRDVECKECGDPRPCRVHDTPVELTSVERAASQRMRLMNERIQLLDDKALVLSVLANMMQRCNRTIGTRIEVPRCTGGLGREGHIEWGVPSCTNVPSRREICDRCRMAEARWRKKNELKQRDEDAA